MMRRYSKFNSSIDEIQKMMNKKFKEVTIRNEYYIVNTCSGSKYIFNQENLFDFPALDNKTESYDEVLREIIKPGYHVIEAGACWGYYTIYLSKLVGNLGKVYAYEPQTEAFRILTENLKLNHCENVICYNKALMNSQNEITIRRKEGNLLFSSTAKNFEEFYVEEMAEAVRLDDFKLAKCDVLRVDIEGAEYSLIEGSEKTIKKLSPIIIIEIFKRGLQANGRCGTDILEMLPGYSAFYVRNNLLEPVSSINDLDCEDVFLMRCEHIKRYERLFRK